jgi:hypothetical protein
MSSTLACVGTQINNKTLKTKAQSCDYYVRRVGHLSLADSFMICEI